MAISDDVRKGVVQAQVTGPVTQGAWGILVWEVIIFACISGSFFHSSLVGFIVFIALIFFIGSHPVYTILTLSLGYGIGAFVAHLNGVGESIHGVPLWLDSMGTGFVIFVVTLLFNSILVLFSSDLL